MTHEFMVVLTFFIQVLIEQTASGFSRRAGSAREFERVERTDPGPSLETRLITGRTADAPPAERWLRVRPKSSSQGVFIRGRRSGTATAPITEQPNFRLTSRFLQNS